MVNRGSVFSSESNTAFKTNKKNREIKTGKIREPAKLLRASLSLSKLLFSLQWKEGVVVVCQVPVKVYLFT